MLFQLDHQDSGFGKCEIVNKCTSEKNNTRAGYKLYAGKYTINWIQEMSYKNIRMTQRTEWNRFSLILIGWHAYYPETWLREESGDTYDDDWFDWKLHTKLPRI